MISFFKKNKLEYDPFRLTRNEILRNPFGEERIQQQYVVGETMKETFTGSSQYVASEELMTAVNIAVTKTAAHQGRAWNGKNNVSPSRITGVE